MKRRQFLKAGIAITTAAIVSTVTATSFLLPPKPQNALDGWADLYNMVRMEGETDSSLKKRMLDKMRGFNNRYTLE